jgi:outer membrane protein assembly factor BamD
VNRFPLKNILPFIWVLLSALLLNGCAIFGEERMVNKDYVNAIKFFEKLETRFPHGVYATQAQLEIAYAYYKQDNPILCVAAVERFIKLHPNHPNVDYAYYLKGLALFNERGRFDKLTKQEISDRDPKTLKLSFAALKELTERYPNSKYTKDATQRMIYLVNALAEHEMHVSRYYMYRKAYVAALNRAKYVMEYYPNSTSVESALVMMVSAYKEMEMDDLKDDTLRILKTNYPNNPMISGKIVEEEKVWWKFWDIM